MESPSHLMANREFTQRNQLCRGQRGCGTPGLAASGTKKRPNHESGLKDMNI